MMESHDSITFTAALAKLEMGKDASSGLRFVSRRFEENDVDIYWALEQANDNKLIWRETDLLAFIDQKTLLSIYSSVSHRIYGDEISLRHFWIDISKQEN